MASGSAYLYMWYRTVLLLSHVVIRTISWHSRHLKFMSTFMVTRSSGAPRGFAQGWLHSAAYLSSFIAHCDLYRMLDKLTFYVECHRAKAFLSSTHTSVHYLFMSSALPWCCQTLSLCYYIYYQSSLEWNLKASCFKVFVSGQHGESWEKSFGAGIFFILLSPYKCLNSAYLVLAADTCRKGCVVYADIKEITFSSSSSFSIHTAEDSHYWHSSWLWGQNEPFA